MEHVQQLELLLLLLLLLLLEELLSLLVLWLLLLLLLSLSLLSTNNVSWLLLRISFSVFFCFNISSFSLFKAFFKIFGIFKQSIFCCKSSNTFAVINIKISDIPSSASVTSSQSFFSFASSNKSKSTRNY